MDYSMQSHGGGGLDLTWVLVVLIICVFLGICFSQYMKYSHDLGMATMTTTNATETHRISEMGKTVRHVSENNKWCSIGNNVAAITNSAVEGAKVFKGQAKAAEKKEQIPALIQGQGSTIPALERKKDN